MSGTNSSGYNVRRHQAKSKHLNLYERLAGDISVSDITAGAIDALYSLHSRRGDLEQLRRCFNERLAVKGVQGIVASANVVPLFSEEESEEPPF
jgi:hypothetical protein